MVRYNHLQLYSINSNLCEKKRLKKVQLQSVCKKCLNWLKSLHFIYLKKKHLLKFSVIKRLHIYMGKLLSDHIPAN